VLARMCHPSESMDYSGRRTRGTSQRLDEGLTPRTEVL
jgi:hypothetical protein